MTDLLLRELSLSPAFVGVLATMPRTLICSAITIHCYHVGGYLHSQAFVKLLEFE